MKNITEWQPDTHPNVVVHLEWDTEDPAEMREHKYVRVIINGQNVSEPHVYGPILHEEHRRKNDAHGHIVDNLPVAMKKPLLDADADPVIDERGPVMVVKDKHLPVWEHHGHGKYTFKIPGMVPNHEHAAIRQSLFDKFGDRCALAD